MSIPSNPHRIEQQLVTQSVGEETLIYDESRHLAFCLDGVASAVWQQCDGHQTIAQIAANASRNLADPITEEIVVVALAQFEKDSLLQVAEISYAKLGACSRRSLVGKLGASAALLLPAVAMIAAPKAAQAYNGCADCTNGQRQAARRNNF